MGIGMILAAIALVWVFVYTLSYGIWTWRQNNKVGGIAVILLSIISLVLPIAVLAIRM